MHRSFPLLLILLCAQVMVGQQLPALREGDLLFQDLDCGGLCDAIEAVTEGANGKDYSHVGIVAKVDGRKVVVEAIGDSVHTTEIDVFTARGAKITVGRMHDRRLAERAAAEALRLIGVPYDEAFLPGTDRLYCSELVALAYERANNGTPVFPAAPMTFKEPSSGAFFPVWVSYYAARGRAIPEGEPGCNPGALSRAPQLRIVWSSF
ncbi:MAG TPA: YiiX/YebB-like N1pC/P60 family cysteine hydrolase [Flavobacteriales bacterium]|jgi:hypothetical protein|nr:YiiX/YebB-like N1pC/P60 family cysteine hydrolase [Flavobacteriales bacterium]